MTDEVPGVVSAALRRTVVTLGPAARRWLEGLPALAADTARAWELELGPSVAQEGETAVVLAATTRDGTPAVLKLTVPHDEARHEADALRCWDGDGAVRLRRSSSDGFVLLLERCDPGHDLWRAPVATQIDVLAELLPRLWSVPDPGVPFPRLAETAARWGMQMAARAAATGLPTAVADRATRWAGELRDDQPVRLLHGDLHPGNVLAAGREPWLAIDPKPWVGDPAFDLAQVLANWASGAPGQRGGTAVEVRRAARELAQRLSLDLDRVLRWAVVKSVGWESGRDEVLLLDEAAGGGRTR